MHKIDDFFLWQEIDDVISVKYRLTNTTEDSDDDSSDRDYREMNLKKIN